MREVVISTETIELEALLKWAGLARTGGEAKMRIQGGEIRVNGAPERRRGRLLRRTRQQSERQAAEKESPRRQVQPFNERA